MLHRNGSGAGEFLSSVSRLGKIIFFLTFIIAFFKVDSFFHVFYFYSVIIALGISFIATFFFELIYGLFRNKSNLG